MDTLGKRFKRGTIGRDMSITGTAFEALLVQISDKWLQLKQVRTATYPRYVRTLAK